jgi:hypothetical protein
MRFSVRHNNAKTSGEDQKRGQVNLSRDPGRPVKVEREREKDIIGRDAGRIYVNNTRVKMFQQGILGAISPHFRNKN